MITESVNEVLRVSH